MGYRSDVGIAIMKTDFDNLIKLSKENGSYKLLQEADTIVERDDRVILRFVSIKWYDGDKDVDFIIHFLNHIADGYGYIEIGEDYNDITSEYKDSENGLTFYDYVSLVREVYIPEGKEISLPAN